jgi:hypothetical protein
MKIDIYLIFSTILQVVVLNQLTDTNAVIIIFPSSDLFKKKKKSLDYVVNFSCGTFSKKKKKNLDKPVY